MSLSHSLAAGLSRGAQVLEPEVRAVLARFIAGQQARDGGYCGRTTASDLYYTVFGLACAGVLGVPEAPDRVRRYLEPLGDGSGLDLVHQTCLCRVLGYAGETGNGPAAKAALGRLEAFRSRDGGYHRQPGQAQGLVYETFLGWLAYDSLGLEPPKIAGPAFDLGAFRTRDGGYANAPGLNQGTTPVTAAAVNLGIVLGTPVDAAAGDWLRARLGADGGFRAGPVAPWPDLLSTATALQALSSIQGPLEGAQQTASLEFVEGLWAASGGFCGHWADPIPDIEYTFYGLLALGYLGLAPATAVNNR